MAKPTHNLVIKTGEYIDYNGSPKGRWLHIGKVFRYEDGGTSIKLDCIPILKDWDGWVSVFKIEDKDQASSAAPATTAAPAAAPRQRAPAPAAPQAAAAFNDDIPF